MRLTILAAGVTGLATAAQGQSLQLTVEYGPSLADGVLGVGETAQFTIRAHGTAGSEPYRALASLFGLTLTGMGPGTFTQTGQNMVLTNLPGSPELVYDNDAGTISMLDTGGFVQLAGILPTDNHNPVFLFSFDWTPAEYHQTVAWTLDATHGSVYVGGDPGDPATWTTLDATEVAGDRGGWSIPSPSAASAIVLAAAAAARRRR